MTARRGNSWRPIPDVEQTLEPFAYAADQPITRSDQSGLKASGSSCGIPTGQTFWWGGKSDGCFLWRAWSTQPTPQSVGGRGFEMYIGWTDGDQAITALRLHFCFCGDVEVDGRGSPPSADPMAENGWGEGGIAGGLGGATEGWFWQWNYTASSSDYEGKTWAQNVLEGFADGASPVKGEKQNPLRRDATAIDDVSNLPGFVAEKTTGFQGSANAFKSALLSPGGSSSGGSNIYQMLLSIGRRHDVVKHPGKDPCWLAGEKQTRAAMDP